MNFHLFHGGIENGDFSALKRAAISGETFEHWSSLKSARTGDVVFFYVPAPVSGIVATGRVLRDAHSGRNWQYEAEVGNIKWLQSPVLLKRLKREFPGWRWVDYPRSKLTLDAAKADRLLKLTRLNQDSPSTEVLIRGAGFGTAERNTKVEKAAIRFVSKHMNRLGYEVRSVEKDWLGFDLLCKNQSGELLVEVKGISGLGDGFQITPHELACARENTSFRLAVVNGALSRRPRLTILTARQMFTVFQFKPVSFFASLVDS